VLFTIGAIVTKWRISQGISWTQFAWSFNQQLDRTATFGLGCMFLLYALVRLERDRGIRLPLFQMLGDSSYSIYLTHLLYLMCLGSIANAFGVTLYTGYGARYIVLCIGVPIAVGVVTYLVVERPVLLVLNRLLAKSRVFKLTEPGLFPSQPLHSPELAVNTRTGSL
jgi:peptidoglycan/LPS O-acetylase OafA/YrhL